jgi:hypothetical protein
MATLDEPFECLFPLGEVILSYDIHDLINPHWEPRAVLPDSLRQLLKNHATGEWGNLTPDDIEENKKAIEEEDVVLSKYLWEEKNIEIYIISHLQLHETSILTPEEY